MYSKEIDNSVIADYPYLMPTTRIAIPKKALADVLAAGRRFVVAEDALEDAVLASEPAFIRKIRRLRAEHIRGATGQWQLLKTKHGLYKPTRIK